MNRLDRLQAIIIQLQSKKVVKAQEIADRFEISLRTVYRDIRSLEEAGVPIGAEAGVGYFLSENYNLPPIMFTANEALSMLLAGKMIPYFSDKQTSNSFQNALTKVKAVLNIEHKDMVEKMESNIQVFSSHSDKHKRDSIYLQDIQWALIQQKVLDIAYYSPYNDEDSCRLVEPITLMHYAGNWHIVAFCQLRKSFRDFRLDRIKSLEILNESYERNLGAAFEQYLEMEKEKMPVISIELEFDIAVITLLNESKHWYGYISEEKIDDKVLMKFVYFNIASFARWIISMGAAVNVVKPIALSNEIQKLTKELAKHYL